MVLALLASLAVAAGAAPAGADSGPPFVGEIGTSPDGVAVVVDPVDVAVGPGGHVFVLQAGSQAEVQELTSAGAVVRSWGGPGTGEGQFSGAAALAVGGGRVYVADQPSGAGAGRVQVFDASGGFVSSFAAGTSPSGLAVGPGGDLFLSDRGSSASGDGSVLRFGVDGTPLGPFGSVPGVEPSGLAFAPGGDLYLTDLGASSSIKRVVQLAADGSFVRAWGSRGSGSGQFTTPDGIGVDAVGRVYVADNRRVQAFTAEGAFVSSSVAYAPAGPYYSYNPLLRGLAVDAASGTVYVAQQGQAPYDRDWLEKRTTAGVLVDLWGADVGEGRVYRPGGVDIGPDGLVYVADTGNSRVQVFEQDGDFVREWGSYGSAGDQFAFPLGLAVAEDGKVYVADSRNDRVKVFSSTGSLLFEFGEGAGGSSQNGRLDTPNDVAIGPSGDVVVADTDNHQVHQFTADGTFVRRWGGTTVYSPVGVAVGPSGDVYVVDATVDEQVHQFTATGAVVRSFGALSRPEGIAIDDIGRVTVVDALASVDQVKQYAADGTLLRSWGSAGTGPGAFDDPGDVAVSSAGGLFVADTANDRVQVFAGEAAALSARLSADETDVLPGDTIHYHLRIANVGSVPLTGVTVADAVAPGCAGPVPDLAVAAVVTVDCERLTTAVDGPLLVNVATVDADQTAPVASNEYEVTVSRFATPQFARTWWASPTGLPDGDPPDSSAIAVDPDGNLRVAGDRAFRPARAVSRFEPDGTFLDRILDPDGPSGVTEPNAVAVAPSGEVYLASGASSEVHRFTPEGAFDGEVNVSGQDLDVAPDGTVYGLSRTGRIFEVMGDSSVYFAGNPGSAPGLHHEPEGLAVGPDGRVYVADTGNHRISVFNPDGSFDRTWGSDGSGNGQFDSLTGIAVDGAGRVYVDDGTRMQVFSADGQYLGKFGVTSDRVDVRIDDEDSVHVYLGAPDGSVVELAFPTGPMARVELSSTVTQVDVGQTVGFDAKVTNVGAVPLTGLVVVASALPGCAGPVDDLAPGASRTVSCDEVPVAADIGRLRRVVGVASDQTPLVLSNPVAVEVRTGVVAAWGAAGSGPGRFTGAAGIATAGGDVYVAECGNDRVQRFTRDGEFVSLWGASGTGPGQFDCPIDVARSGSTLFVLDQGNRRVQQFDLDGTFMASWSTRTTAPGVPTAIDTDPDGNVYVVDSQEGFYGPPCYDYDGTQFCTWLYPSDNNRVRVFDADGVPLSSWGGATADEGSIYLPRGLFVTSDGYVEVANRGRGLHAGGTRVPLPGVDVWDVAEDDQHDIYVADRANSLVRKYSPGGSPLAQWPVSRPSSLTVTGDGRVYVTSQDRIVVLEGVGAGPALWGTVTDAATGEPVPGAQVAVLRASDLSFDQGATTDAGGVYSARVAPGAYRLYVIDPTGDHADRFAGGSEPDLVTVVAGASTQADASVPSTRGTVAGVVAEQGTGTPIASAYTILVDATTGIPRRGAAADASGEVTVGDVDPGSHLVLHLDRSGAHAPAYHPGSPVPSGAQPVTVTAGATAESNAMLPTQTVDPGGVTIEGRVSATPGSLVVAAPGALVVALRASDYRFVRATTTDADGDYALDVSPGTYKLAFVDPSGTSSMEWYQDEPFDALGAAATVTAPATVDVSLSRAYGGISGSVRDPDNRAIVGAWILAFGSDGRVVRGTTSSDAGNYNVRGLAVGAYRLAFVDPLGGHEVRFYRDQPTPFTAEEVQVTGLGIVAGVRAELPG